MNNSDKEKNIFQTYAPDQQNNFDPDILMREEEAVQERTDKHGNIWKKVYFGSGSHYENWVDQFREVHGEENVEVEEVTKGVCKCYSEGGDVMKRIWVKCDDLE